MPQSSRIRQFFERPRQPGDLVFAVVFLLLSVFLLSQLGTESKWIKGTKTFAQPMFWPAVSLIGMVLFAACHFIGALCSKKSTGRWTEVSFWLRSIEYALWFMLYVWLVPIAGYLPTTLLFSLVMTYRVGYRDRGILTMAAITALVIVIVFKGLLSVKIPGGAVYEYLPQALRNFMILYL